jgi:teichuronic acid biosynthesis glycosyltransferase TuaC
LRRKDKDGIAKLCTAGCAKVTHFQHMQRICHVEHCLQCRETGIDRALCVSRHWRAGLRVLEALKRRYTGAEIFPCRLFILNTPSPTPDNSPCRIALVTPMLPVPHDPSSGRYIYEIALALSKVAQVKVFLEKLRYPRLPGIRPKTYFYGELDAHYTLEGIDVQALSYPGVPGLTRAINGRMAARVLLPQVRTFRPDIVLAYWVYPDGDAAVRVASALQVPCVVGALGSDIHVRSGVSNLLTRRVIARCQALLTVSEAMRQYTIKQFGGDPQRIHTIINGFNTAVFKPLAQSQARQALNLAHDEQLIVFVGRLVKEKGLAELLQAFNALAAEQPKLRLAVLGDGQMRTEFAAMVAASPHGQAVRILGAVSHAQVAQWIAASDLLTLPSWSEGYPNVVVEALACGRPVVATDVGGIPEIVDDSCGMLVPIKDAQALQQALAKTLAKPWDHDAIAARMRRTWDDVATDTLAICNTEITQFKQHRL